MCWRLPWQKRLHLLLASLSLASLSVQGFGDEAPRTLQASAPRGAASVRWQFPWPAGTEAVFRYPSESQSEWFPVSTKFAEDASSVSHNELKLMFHGARTMVLDASKVIGAAHSVSFGFTTQIDEAPLIALIKTACNASDDTPEVSKAQLELDSVVTKMLLISSQVAELGDAVRAVADTLEQVLEVLRKAVAKLPYEGKVGGYGALFDGFPFTSVTQEMFSHTRAADLATRRLEVISGRSSHRRLSEALVELVGPSEFRSLLDASSEDHLALSTARGILLVWRDLGGVLVSMCESIHGMAVKVEELKCRTLRGDGAGDESDEAGVGFMVALHQPPPSSMVNLTQSCGAASEAAVRSKETEADATCPSESGAETFPSSGSCRLGREGWLSVLVETFSDGLERNLLISALFVAGFVLTFFGVCIREYAYPVLGFLAGLDVWFVLTSLFDFHADVFQSWGSWLFIVFILAMSSFQAAVSYPDSMRDVLFGCNAGALLGTAAALVYLQADILEYEIMPERAGFALSMLGFLTLVSALFCGTVMGVCTQCCIRGGLHVPMTALAGGFLVIRALDLALGGAVTSLHHVLTLSAALVLGVLAQCCIVLHTQDHKNMSHGAQVRRLVAPEAKYAEVLRSPKQHPMASGRTKGCYYPCVSFCKADDGLHGIQRGQVF